MKKELGIAILLLAGTTGHAQFTIQPNAVFKTAGNVQITLDNISVVNNSAATDLANAVLVLKGATTATLGGNGNWQVKRIKVDKGAGVALLGTAISISEKVQFASGRLDLNNRVLTLGTNAYLENETESSRIIGPNGGTVQITKTLNAPQALNAGNLGAVITSSASLGTVTIRRMHKVPNETGRVQRFYEIQPANNRNLNAQLRLHYFDAERSGLSEAGLVLDQRTSSAGLWEQIGYTSRSNTFNYVEKAGLTSLHQYAFVPAVAAAVAASDRSLKMAERSSVSLYPVPAVCSAVLSLLVPVAGEARVRIMADDGRMHLQLAENLQAGLNTVPLDVSRLAAGVYFVQVQLPDSSTAMVRLVKQ